MNEISDMHLSAAEARDVHQNTQQTISAFQQSGDYPFGAFPKVLSDTVHSLMLNVQAPVELIAGAVLSAVSLACQTFIKVQFPDGRLKPCSLYNIVLAGSGERKSAVYSLVMQPFLDYEKEQIYEYEQALKKYNIQMLIWQNKQNVIMRKMAKKMEREEDYDMEEYELEEHGLEKPVKPARMKLIYSDTTPEALQYSLYENLSSAGLMSDEASIFFAGRAKNNLGFLNQMWDGSPFDIERRSSESFSVEGSFTMLLMIQPDLFMQYFMKHGKIAKGSGFLARFLVSSVSSTQGLRQPVAQINLEALLGEFHSRIKELLVNVKEHVQNNVEPERIRLSQSAQVILYEYQLYIEMLIKQYKVEALTSFLSKVPENLARLAALFHYFSEEEGDEVTENTFKNACRVMDYYINQAMVLYTRTLASPEQDADYLFQWMSNRVSTTGKVTMQINKAEVRRFVGRTHLRDNKRLNGAIKILTEQGRIYVDYIKNGNGSTSEIICINH